MSKSIVLARFAEKLRELRFADRHLKIYGARRHRYRLNPPLKEAKLVEFEKRVRCVLPDVYRTYLLEFADGGAGPDNGVKELKLDLDHTQWPLDVEFPISTETARGGISEPPRSRYLDGEAYEDYDGSLPGTLDLSDGGCGIRSFLVCSGEQRGIIWYWGAVNELYPAQGKGDRQIGFFEWYENWLDDSLKRATGA